MMYVYVCYHVIQTCYLYRWGVFCGDYPIPVIVGSVSVAVLLTLGVFWLEVTTDPVELWAGPSEIL